LLGAGLAAFHAKVAEELVTELTDNEFGVEQVGVGVQEIDLVLLVISKPQFEEV
jgi:hypothetical protein